MSLFWTNFYIFLLATLLATLEIQIEGKHGWANKLPTWRSRLTLWGKEITGYHLTLLLLLLLFFHFPYLWGVELNLNTELRLLSLFLLFTALEDFLWFILNPHYPIKSFKKGNIPWHQSWFLGLPIDYYISLLTSIIVLVPALSKDLFLWWITNLSLFIGWLLLMVVFSLKVLRIDRWLDN